MTFVFAPPWSGPDRAAIALVTEKGYARVLPAHVAGTQLRAVQSRLKVDMRSLFAEAGIRWRDRAGRVQLRTDDPGPLVYALPLQTADGRVRADAAKRLARDVFGGGLDEAARQVLQTPGLHKMDIDRWMGLRLAFMQEADALTAVRDLVAAQPECRLYRLGGTQALMRRQVVWRILEHLGSVSLPRGRLEGRDRGPGKIGASSQRWR